MVIYNLNEDHTHQSPYLYLQVIIIYLSSHYEHVVKQIIELVINLKAFKVAFSHYYYNSIITLSYSDYLIILVIWEIFILIQIIIEPYFIINL